MKILVVGASGATGRLVVSHLLERGHSVRAVVRNRDSLPKDWRKLKDLEIVEASLLDGSDAELADFVEGCDGIVSCLGHNLTWRGVFGPPRRLVTEAVRRLCEAVQKSDPEKPVRFVLMNTTGNRDPDRDEPVSAGERFVLFLLRHLIPPHADNEDAARVLRSEIEESDSMVEWCVVRPDSLVDKESVSEYEIHESPTRSAIFDAGKTSRINVADFMARLATEEELWETWRYRMPVVYNQDS